MSDPQLLRAFVTERLALAADEIFGLVERTMADYRDELVRSKREILQLRRELDYCRQPQSQRSTDAPEVSEEMFAPLHEWSPNLEPEQSPDPSSQQVKEEEMELNLEAGPSDSLEDLHNEPEMHHSIIPSSGQHVVERCTTCCKLFHCPLCPPCKYKPSRPSKLQMHLAVHKKNAITFEDMKICRCNLNCRDGGHFHCPICDKTIIRKKDMEGHLETCQGAHNRQQLLPALYISNLDSRIQVQID